MTDTTTTNEPTTVVEQQPQEQKPTYQNFLENLEHGQKPWYFSSLEIYKLVKHAATSIPQSEALFEKALDAIGVVTKYIKDSTRMNVAFEVKDTHELVNNLDHLLSQQLVVVDDGMDEMRGRLGASLRQLIDAIIQHRNWAEEYAGKTSHTARDTIRTRYEQFIVLMHTLVEEAKKRYPGTVGRVTTIATQSYETTNNFIQTTKSQVEGGIDQVKKSVTQVDLTLYGNVLKLLKIAQPYVQDAYVKSTPYLDQAAQMGQPYLEKAKPYIDPVVVKANKINQAALDNQRVGPYLSKVYETANYVLVETKTYVTPPQSQPVAAAH